MVAAPIQKWKCDCMLCCLRLGSVLLDQFSNSFKIAKYQSLNLNNLLSFKVSGKVKTDSLQYWARSSSLDFSKGDEVIVDNCVELDREINDFSCGEEMLGIEFDDWWINGYYRINISKFTKKKAYLYFVLPYLCVSIQYAETPTINNSIKIKSKRPIQRKEDTRPVSGRYDKISLDNVKNVILCGRLLGQCVFVYFKQFHEFGTSLVPKNCVFTLQNREDKSFLKMTQIMCCGVARMAMVMAVHWGLSVHLSLCLNPNYKYKLDYYLFYFIFFAVNDNNCIN
ncbi:hypothetical protein RFI_40015 [Reticulomyxa filosa]|uniref:Uncharacterized protein n=1 Tax=Reticulomyxa filosa TaxID=46433 RepID=X6L9W1_RETFI|nr:hypothetical protein RFI_40015 [Reticulomyxa filosa]|eukprot:ETN97514.1 hypothetical protein RFI_40015 [Reticulomyxa filosa]